MAFTLTVTHAAHFVELAKSLAVHFASVDLKLEQIATDSEDLATTMLAVGADKDFEAFEAVRIAFVGALENKSTEAAQKIWERAYRSARETKAGETLPAKKPASASAEAQRKAEARKTKAEDPRTVMELKAEGDKLTAEGKIIEAGKVLELAAKKAKKDQAAADQAARAETKPQADAVRDALNALVKANDKQGIAMMHKLAVILAAGQHAKVAKTISGWKMPEPK